MYEKLKFIKRAIEIFPNLNCGVSSSYLKNKYFRDSIIVRGKYQNFNHTFLLVENEIIVDITADQYDGPKCYVGPIINPWKIKSLL